MAEDLKQAGASSFLGARLKAAILPHQEGRKVQSIADASNSAMRQSQSQDPKDVDIDFSDPDVNGIAKRVVRHNLDHDPIGWIVIKSDQFVMTRKVPLTGADEGKEKNMIALEASMGLATGAKLKVRFF